MMDRRRRVTVSVQTYALAPLVVANSDCLCTLPRRFLAKYAAAIEIMEPPFALDAMGLTAFWHPRHQDDEGHGWRSEEHTSELQSLMRISYAVFCLKKKHKKQTQPTYYTTHNN